MNQHISLTGNLGKDPEMRYTPDGTAVTNFTVGTNRTYTRDGEKVQETTWFRVASWGKMAENVNRFLRKGSLVQVEGRLTPDPQTGGPKTYTTQDGKVGATFEVTSKKVIFLANWGDNEPEAKQEEKPELPF